MEEIKENKCIALMREKFPKFLPYWESYIKNDGINNGITIQVTSFAEYTVATLKSNNEAELRKIFGFVEFLLNKGNEAVKDAMATGYLESLMHRDPDEIKFRNFVKYLGKHAIQYCRAWDKFTGCKTDGLWNYEEINTMEYGKKFEEFELSKDELNKIAADLISQELEVYNPAIEKSATILDATWLMCPDCIDAWESASKSAMVICPKCNQIFHNPRFQKDKSWPS